MSFCRDCLADVPDQATRCPTCRSPRLRAPSRARPLTIAHIDCDAFYATIEKRDDPSLRNKPLIIGGGKRGVVATACYIARTYGIRSAMPMFEARHRCPDAVVIKPNMAKYAAVGRDVRQAMRALTPLVEPLSIDEAFLDLSGTERLHGMSAAKVLARFALAVERDVGITVSVGLAANKFLAKIASDLDKPRGYAVLGQAEAAAFLAPRPVGFIYGVGAVSAARLAKDGYRLIADLQRASETDLMRRYGEEGARLARLARGIDTRKVDPEQRDQEHLGRNHLRARYRRVAPARTDAVGTDREGLRPPEGGVARRLNGHAQAKERRLQAAHACALTRRADAAWPRASSPPATTC